MSQAAGRHFPKQISLAPVAADDRGLKNTWDVLPTRDVGLYFVASPQKGAPLGPYNRAQILEAVRSGRLGPRERIWVSGLNSWLVVRDVFGDFFDSEQGQVILAVWHQRLTAYRRIEWPCLLVDLVLQAFLSLPLVVLMVLKGFGFVAVTAPVVVGPVLYWLVSGVVFGGRSFGMRVFGVRYINLRSGQAVRGFEAVVRGTLSFLLALVFWFEIGWLFRSKMLFSSHLMGLKAVFDEDDERVPPAAPRPSGLAPGGSQRASEHHPPRPPLPKPSSSSDTETHGFAGRGEDTRRTTEATIRMHEARPIKTRHAKRSSAHRSGQGTRPGR